MKRDHTRRTEIRCQWERNKGENRKKGQMWKQVKKQVKIAYTHNDKKPPSYVHHSLKIWGLNYLSETVWASVLCDIDVE